MMYEKSYSTVYLEHTIVLLGTTPSATFKNVSSNVGCGNQLFESWRGNFTERQRDNNGLRFFLGGSSRSID